MEEFVGYRDEIRERFSSLSDYLWKLPGFIESERQLELRKLDDYFPNIDTGDPDKNAWLRQGRCLRFLHEFSKLEVDFPDFMAASSLIHLMSLFEFYLLGICKIYERMGYGDLRMFLSARRGIKGLLAYAQYSVGSEPVKGDFEIMRRAAVFRNCLAHTNGLLDDFSEAKLIRQTISSRQYFTAVRRKKSLRDLEIEPQLAEHPFGERLIVPLPYTHWLNSTASRSLIEICDTAVGSTSD